MAGMQKDLVVGDGEYQLKMRWHQASYDPVSGNGISEYHFHFDDGPGMPPNFPRIMEDSTSRIRLFNPSRNKLVMGVQGAGHVDTTFRGGAKIGHLCGYCYVSDAFGQDTPFLFGRDDDTFITWQEINLELTPDEFVGEEYIEHALIAFIVESIGSLDTEHENALVTLSYEYIDTTIRIIPTPDRGYVAGVTVGDPFFVDDVVDGSSIEDVVSDILGPAIARIAYIMKMVEESE